MNRADMIAVVGKLCAADGTEEELDGLLYAPKQTPPRTGIGDLIHYPDRERTLEGIVDEVVRREHAHMKNSSGAAAS
jgi:hypothetical protein